MKLLLTIVACAVFMVGCKPSNEQITEIAKNEISEMMKDPASTKFSELLTKELSGVSNNGKSAYCVFGRVNGKNSFGAYSGFSPFAITIVTESGLIPFTKPTYNVASKIVVHNDVDSIHYKAIQQLCN
ncbi:hypothetical protein U0868_01265 [Kluyvera ascorbata]|uniref:hypothetical protein n=1 Tax=Kluyvera ascorbata TaxID=51288 RepID=UPI002ABA5A70|nr:hypothetical protein [Kluyvera ascorbata]MDZ4030186.1 hypothetical protein [Kluyvera ascorbata]